jgi:hypothetical protein
MEAEGRDLGDAGGAGLTGEGMRRIALEELALRRRRLGELTTAQERALESLLVSVADNISGLVSAATADTPRRGRGEEACAPTVIRVGALSPARPWGPSRLP